ncbi:exodeoxyribonuclease VII large subunit, partial [Eggerthella sinensis]
MGNGEKGSEALSVSGAMALAKGALEGVTVRLMGEVSEVSNKPGYKAVYFTVKDPSAALPCMMWNNRFQASGVRLAVGQLVELTGRFTLYAPKGRMNFDVFSIALAGEGNLRLQVANLARKLEAEGLMRPERKRPLPAYPVAIGLVTSPRGAAVHDVLRTLRRRFPLARVLVAGVAVEGAQAPAGIVEGMRAVVRAGAEVVLVVRGGGSFEDLMPFNDEGLARMIGKCPVPVVTGIGHEPDTSIADMVADVRASTPTAAAEAVSPARESLARLFEARCGSLRASMGRALDRAGAEVRRCATRPLFCDAQLLYATEAQMLDMAADRLFRALPANLARDEALVERQRERLACALPASLD